MQQKKEVLNKNKNKQNLSLSDETILEFVKIFQRGIIECRDVTQDFRALELVTKKLVPAKKA